MKELNIEIGKVYDFFDDGKIWESRREEVKILEIIPFDEIDQETLEQWQLEIEDEYAFGFENGYHLYAKQTDYFIKAITIYPRPDDIYYFVRTVDGGWFGIGFMASGRLDIDGSLRKSYK